MLLWLMLEEKLVAGDLRYACRRETHVPAALVMCWCRYVPSPSNSISLQAVVRKNPQSALWPSSVIAPKQNPFSSSDLASRRRSSIYSTILRSGSGVRWPRMVSSDTISAMTLLHERQVRVMPNPRIDSSKIIALIEVTRLIAGRPRLPYGEPSRRGKPAHAASIRRRCSTLTLALKSPSLPLGAPSLHLGAPRRRASIQNRGPRRTTF